MSANSKTFVMSKNIGETIPQDFVELAVLQYSSWGGIAVLDEGGLGVIAEKSAPDVEQIMQMQEDNKNNGMLFVLGNEADPISDDNLQPFTVLKDAEGEPSLIVLIAGDLSKFEDAKSNQSNAYRAVTSLIGRKVKAFDRMAKGDLAAVMEEVRQEGFDTELLEALAPPEETVMACLMSTAGNPVTFYQGTDIGEFKWGITSESFGYGEFPKEKEDAPTEPAKPLTAREKLLARKNKGKTEETALGAALQKAGVTPVTTAKTTAASPPKKEGSKSTEPIFGRVPPGYSNNKNREWHSLWTKTNPPFNFKERPWVAIHPSMVDQYLAQRHEIRPPVAADAPKQVTASGKTGPVTPPKTVAAPVKPAAKAVPAPTILNAENKQKLSKFLKTLDLNSLEIISPEQMEAEEKIEPSFVEVAGAEMESMDEVLKWPRLAFRSLIKDNPEAAELLMRDMQWALINLASETVTGEEEKTEAA